MILKDQFINLEFAKKLKELNVKQDSLMIHVELAHLIQKNPETEEYVIIETKIQTGFAANCYYDDKYIVNKYAAFSVPELLEILPETLEDSSESIIIQKIMIGKQITYLTEYRYGIAEIQDVNLANCLAKMLIHLIENKLYEPS
jgi:hypothetical protein